MIELSHPLSHHTHPIIPTISPNFLNPLRQLFCSSNPTFSPFLIPLLIYFFTPLILLLHPSHIFSPSFTPLSHPTLSSLYFHLSHPSYFIFTLLLHPSHSNPLTPHFNSTLSSLLFHSTISPSHLTLSPLLLTLHSFSLSFAPPSFSLSLILSPNSLTLSPRSHSFTPLSHSTFSAHSLTTLLHFSNHFLAPSTHLTRFLSLTPLAPPLTLTLFAPLPLSLTRHFRPSPSICPFPSHSPSSIPTPPPSTYPTHSSLTQTSLLLPFTPLAPLLTHPTLPNSLSPSQSPFFLSLNQLSPSHSSHPPSYSSLTQHSCPFTHHSSPSLHSPNSLPSHSTHSLPTLSGVRE